MRTHLGFVGHNCALNRRRKKSPAGGASPGRIYRNAALFSLASLPFVVQAGANDAVGEDGIEVHRAGRGPNDRDDGRQNRAGRLV